MTGKLKKPKLVSAQNRHNTSFMLAYVAQVSSLSFFKPEIQGISATKDQLKIFVALVSSLSLFQPEIHAISAIKDQLKIFLRLKQ